LIALVGNLNLHGLDQGKNSIDDSAHTEEDLFKGVIDLDEKEVESRN
jgi:hypothetical protein